MKRRVTLLFRHSHAPGLVIHKVFTETLEVGPTIVPHTARERTPHAIELHPSATSRVQAVVLSWGPLDSAQVLTVRVH